eukprot:Sspe_Gene.49163::Locus_26192_Transcript_1_1_Confidence_1.000_Length_1669::g.49163::m.49163
MHPDEQADSTSLSYHIPLWLLDASSPPLLTDYLRKHRLPPQQYQYVHTLTTLLLTSLTAARHLLFPPANTSTLLHLNTLILAASAPHSHTKTLPLLIQSFAILATPPTALHKPVSLVYIFSKIGTTSRYVGETGGGLAARHPTHLKATSRLRKLPITSPPFHFYFTSDTLPYSVPMLQVVHTSPSLRLLGRKIVEQDLIQSVGQKSMNRSHKLALTRVIPTPTRHLGIARHLHKTPDAPILPSHLPRTFPPTLPTPLLAHVPPTSGQHTPASSYTLVSWIIQDVPTWNTSPFTPTIKEALQRFRNYLRHTTDGPSLLQSASNLSPRPHLTISLHSPIPLNTLKDQILTLIHQHTNTTPSDTRITLIQKPTHRNRDIINAIYRRTNHATPTECPCHTQFTHLMQKSLHPTHVVHPLPQDLTTVSPTARRPYHAALNRNALQHLNLTATKHDTLQKQLDDLLRPHQCPTHTAQYLTLLQTAKEQNPLKLTPLDRAPTQWFLVCPHHLNQLISLAFPPHRYTPVTQVETT